MADREKLIELLNEAMYRFRRGEGAWDLPTNFADFLIAHGVTVQKWIPVTERLPEEDVRVLVWLTDEAHSHTKMDTDRRHNNRWVRWGMYVTHWMPLPPAPEDLK